MACWPICSGATTRATAGTKRNSKVRVLMIPSTSCTGCKQCGKGVPNFVYRGVKFTTQEGVLKWVASNRNHIRVISTPSGDCRRCADLRKLVAERKHWHF